MVKHEKNSRWNKITFNPSEFPHSNKSVILIFPVFPSAVLFSQNYYLFPQELKCIAIPLGIQRAQDIIIFFNASAFDISPSGFYLCFLFNFTHFYEQEKAFSYMING